MNESFETSGSSERCEYRGYEINVDATRGERDQWMPSIQVTRDGEPVDIEAPESIGPYWSTREEAVRAGIERARYLLDRRDGTPLDARNPARPP
jgi:hypothetical protein